jgi:hypothetical protein
VIEPTYDSDALALVDAVMTDLEANVELPGPARNRYMKPLVVTPELCPLLSVHLTREVPEQIATGGCYEHNWYLELSWYEAATGVTETGGVGSETLGSRMLFVAQQLVGRLRAWGGVVPGISARYADLEGEIVYDREESSCWRVDIPVHCRGDT